jgi:phasin family protein
MNKKCSDIDALFGANQKAMDELFRAQFHTWEDLSKLQSECAHLWMDCLNAQMQRISSAKNLNDMCATEAGLATEYSMKFSDNLRKVYETLLNSQKEFMKCFNAPEVLFSQPPPEKPERREKSRALEVDKDVPHSKAVS